MTDLDLDLEAAAAAVKPLFIDAQLADHDAEDYAWDAVKAAAPLIAAQVRAQIAADIETRADKIDPPGTMWGRSDAGAGMRAAARIARGES